MNQSTVSIKSVLNLISGLLIPFAAVERTIKLDAKSDKFENDAEHSFLLAVIGCAIADQIDPTLNKGKISQYALVHDLVEAYAGDTTVLASPEKHATKQQRERDALLKIKKRYGKSFKWINSMIEQYNKFDDSESCFVYALDKIIPYLVMNSLDHQAFPQEKVVYEKNMRVARRKIQKYPRLLDLLDEIDADYRKRPHFFL